MTRRKGRGKIHPQIRQHVVHREDPPPPEMLCLGSDHVKRLSFQRENTCLALVEAQYSQPPPISVCYEMTPVKTTSSRHLTKKKEKRTGYNPSMRKKIETLGAQLNPIPFSPKKFLDLAAHKCLLTNLGLWEFLNLDFDKVVIPGFIEQLVANYNPERRRGRSSFVDGYAISVSPTTMASALRLPTKSGARKRKLLDQDYALESGVLAVSAEDALFLVDLVWSFMILHDADCEVPDEVMKIVSDVRDRKLEKVDWSGLVWFMIKRELLKGTTLRNCYYASHMQLLIKHQKPWLFDSGFSGVRLLDMGSAEGGEGYVKDSFDGNGMLLEYCLVDSFEAEARMQIETVKTIDCAQLRYCTLKKSPCLELSLVTAEEEVVGIELAKSQKCKDLMSSLFDEGEDEESKELVKEEAFDANGGAILDNQQDEDATMDTPIDNSNWCLVDGNDDVCNSERRQQIGLIRKQAKGSTEVLSEVLVEENNNILTCEQVCVSHNDYAAKGSTEVLSEVLVEENNNILTSEQVCVSHNDYAAKGSTEVLSEVLVEENNNILTSKQVCISHNDYAVIEPEHKDGLLTKAGATVAEICANSENQEADILLAKEGIQEVVEKPVSPQGSQEKIQENACFSAETGGQYLAIAPLDSGGGGVVDAIVLESDEEEDEEEEREHQLDCIDDGKGFVLQQPSLQNVEEAQSGKCRLARGECYVMSKDLPVHGVSISCQVKDHILPHHTPYHSSVNSVLPGQGMQSYQANAYENEVIEDLRKKLAKQSHLIQQCNILRHHEQEKQKREINRYARQLHLMDGLLIDYKKIIKETDKRIIHCQQPVESQYMDHPDEKGKVITVAEWEKLVQETENQNNCDRIQSMMEEFQDGLSAELGNHFSKLDKLCTRLSGCADSLDIFKAKASRS